METTVTERVAGMEIDSRETLKEAIARLETRQKEDIRLIKADMDDAYESLKPVHVVKALVSEVFTSPDIQKNLLQSAVGLGAGYLAKRAVVGKSHNPIKQLMGYLVQVGVSNVVNSNSDEIQSKGSNLLERLIKRYKSSDTKKHDPDDDDDDY